MAGDHELRLISGLCREMAGLGLTVYMSDARPAAVLRLGGTSVEVTVDPAGACFEWSGGRERHAADDPAGAARRLSESRRR